VAISKPTNAGRCVSHFASKDKLADDDNGSYAAQQVSSCQQ
jgi:hypothetical protein